MFLFKITPDDGDAYELKTDSRDVLMWEKTTKGAAVSNIAKEQRFVDMYKIAYFAARRTGAFTGSQEDFERVHILDLVDEEAEPDPTRPAP